MYRLDFLLYRVAQIYLTHRKHLWNWLVSCSTDFILRTFERSHICADRVFGRTFFRLDAIIQSQYSKLRIVSHNNARLRTSSFNSWIFICWSRIITKTAISIKYWPAHFSISDATIDISFGYLKSNGSREWYHI